MANLNGTSGADTITGTSGSDRIRGLAGDDRLNGAGGNDRIFGGFGNDKNGSGRDTLQGGGGNDFLDGEDGNDALNGGDGNDVIVAGRGNDSIKGGGGNDRVEAAGTLDQYGFSILTGGGLRVVDEVAGRDGRDTIKSLERVGFDDGYVLRLTGANNRPYAVADTAATTEDAPVLIDVLANDFDPDETIFDKATTLSLVSVGPTAEGGTATIRSGKVRYDPGDAFDFLGAGETATDTFDYTIRDNQGATWTSSVTVTIAGTGAGAPSSIDLSTLDGTTGFRLDGAASGDFTGFSVSSAGDVNGDGFDDVIVGAPYAYYGSGVSYVVFGKAGGFSSALDLSTLNGTTGFRLDGMASGYYGGDASGRSVASAGDVNGDGFDDVIVGAFLAEPAGYDSGASYVVFGRAGGFASTLELSTLNGTTGFRLDGASEDDRSGQSVSSAGDVNGDGFDDLIVDAYGYGSGASYVVFGKAAGFASTLNLATLDGTTGFRLDGGGISVASAGDVNGDGFDDLIIGAPGADPGGGFRSGASYVVFGKAGGFAATLDLSTLDGATGFRLDGAASYDQSGDSVSSAGDINGDGFDDVIVGAWTADPAGDGSGASYVVFGKAGGFASTLDLSTLNGATGFRLDGASGDASGKSVASAGDVNGDGFDDLIVSAHGADPGGSGSGASYVVFGKAGGFASTLDLSTLNGTNGFRLDGAAAYDRCGYSVASAGDVDGDGFDDLIVGAPDADPGGDRSGASYVVFGGNFTGAVANRNTPAETLNGSGDSSVTLSLFDVLDQSEEPNILPLDAEDGDAGSCGSGSTIEASGRTQGTDPSRIGGQHHAMPDQALPIDADITSLVA